MKTPLLNKNLESYFIHSVIVSKRLSKNTYKNLTLHIKNSKQIYEIAVLCSSATFYQERTPYGINLNLKVVVFGVIGINQYQEIKFIQHSHIHRKILDIIYVANIIVKCNSCVTTLNIIILFQHEKVSIKLVKKYLCTTKIALV